VRTLICSGKQKPLSPFGRGAIMEVGMSMELKIILVVALVLIGSHLFLWSFIKRKIRSVEAGIAKEKRDGGDGGFSSNSDSGGADCSGGDGGGCD
jgi:hypothetical protein